MVTIKPDKLPPSLQTGQKLVTIQGKMVGLFALVIGAISLFIYLFFPAQLERQALKDLSGKAHSIASMAAFSVSAGVVFEDHEAIRAALQGALLNEDVMYVEVTDAAGVVMSSQRSGKLSLSLPPREEYGTGLIQDRSGYQIRVPVRADDDRVGELYLVLSTWRLQQQIENLRFVIALVSVVVFLVGLIAVALLSRLVTANLRSIAGTARRIANGNLSERAEIDSRDEVGQLAEAFNMMLDQLAGAQTNLKNLSDQFEQILDNLPGQVGVLDLDCHYEYVNPRGMPDPATRESIKGRRPEDYWRAQGFSSGIGERTEAALRRCLAERRVLTVDEKVEDGDGSSRHFLCVFSPMMDGKGQVQRLVHYFVDITDQWNTEQALREKEEQLLHAQKMEAVGRLAGGVAHDFNNLLMAINMHTELTLMALPPDSPARCDLVEIRGAINRASGLTRQLLAFSRKQVLQLGPLDLNEVVAGIEKMLRRLIGEDIDLQIELGEGLGTIEADRGQIEQVVMNLAVNARDAMPAGGCILIETADIDAAGRRAIPAHEPGHYVMLSISDTGVGMDEETLAQIFEPFFTTKELGHGTGLGLATVYGIVKQCGGHVDVQSTPGGGTTFRLYFPQCDGAPTETQEAEVEDWMLRGTETILVVEDERELLELTRRALEGAGYTVLCAEDPEIALQIGLAYDGPIHVILSDVVMPGMSGPQLVERFTRLRLETKIVFMSGYPGTKTDCMRVIELGYPFLQKPFSPAELLKTLREQLEETVSTVA